MQQRVTALKTDRNMWTPEALLEAWHRSLQEKDRKAGTVDVGDPHPDCHHWLPQRAAACTTQIHQYNQYAGKCSACLVWLDDLKLVGGEAASSRTGLKSAQVNEVGRGSLRKSITRSGISMVFPALEQGKVWYTLGRDGVCVDTERMGLTVTLLRSRVIFDWAGITRDSQI